MATYYQGQIDKVLKGAPPVGARYKLKVTGETTETKWLDITEQELRGIRKLLTRK